MKNYASFNIIIVVFIRIVIVFYKNDIFYFTYPPRKHDFSHILPSCFLFIAVSRKYHPVVVLLHNGKWLKKISTKFRRSAFYFVFDIVSFAISSNMPRLQYPRVLHCRIIPIEKLKTLVALERKNLP